MELILNYEFKDGGFIEETGGTVKYWRGFGLPDFEGDWKGFAACYPELMEILVDKRIVKRV